ncbi:HIT-like domain-containing protein [Protomyces lactucae-debilis]|uniref:HIT-like domain-containing protein n=1 Tax=Protomyces lactucae-debilis TaxID=2754530 RepID=A0A1Y2EXK5_PROLT|nr:HIT-like domain-containing protein [Protomyces lactucae-debilis]ORY76308.1 HIT-like domain-containing protein [Protomyces lactucae-debilis]
MSCPFCSIAQGKSDAYIIYENSSLMVLLDVMPITKGHILVIPRQHFPDLLSFPAELAREIGGALPAVSRALTQVLGGRNFNVLNNNGERAGQTVEHLHFHIVPRIEGANWDMFGRSTAYKTGGGHIRGEDLDDDEAAVLTASLKRALQRDLWHGRGLADDSTNHQSGHQSHIEHIALLLSGSAFVLSVLALPAAEPQVFGAPGRVPPQTGGNRNLGTYGSGRNGQVTTGPNPNPQINNREIDKKLQHLKTLYERTLNEHRKIDNREQRFDSDPLTRGKDDAQLSQTKQEDLRTHQQYNQLVQEVRAMGYTGTITPPTMKNVPHTQRTGAPR